MNEEKTIPMVLLPRDFSRPKSQPDGNRTVWKVLIGGLVLLLLFVLLRH
jgi:uncharacterized integral membrane protein